MHTFPDLFKALTTELHLECPFSTHCYRFDIQVYLHLKIPTVFI